MNKSVKMDVTSSYSSSNQEVENYVADGKKANDKTS
jgi:hypothetical protein